MKESLLVNNELTPEPKEIVNASDLLYKVKYIIMVRISLYSLKIIMNIIFLSV